MNMHKKRRDPKEVEKREKGIAENERTNYTDLGGTSAKRDDRNEDDDSTIRETDKKEETDTVGGGGDLAGNAAGNPESED